MRTVLLLATVGCVTSGACAPTPTGAVRTKTAAERAAVTRQELVERGQAFSRVGDLTRAAQYLAAGLRQGADEADVAPLLLGVYVRSRRYRLAIQYGESYLTRHPRDHRTRFLIGSLHAALGDVARALHHLEQVAAADPNHAPAHYALGVVQRDQGNDPAQADLHFRRYLELVPDGIHAEAARASLQPVAE